jgi:hypothetical protein
MLSLVFAINRPSVIHTIHCCCFQIRTRERHVVRSASASSKIPSCSSYALPRKSHSHSELELENILSDVCLLLQKFFTSNDIRIWIAIVIPLMKQNKLEEGILIMHAFDGFRNSMLSVAMSHSYSATSKHETSPCFVCLIFTNKASKVRPLKI